MSANAQTPLKIALVCGEESGDQLGADLVSALARMSSRPIALAGVGGRSLKRLGLESLFDADEIALMGVSAVVRDLPRLIRRIGQTASAIVAEHPDCLVTIDSPDFSLRVARKVRAADPTIPIIHYVCPSVWAWRPGRALAMRPYVDHILCLLPFEPSELERLNGPPGTFVGHRLAQDRNLLAAAANQSNRAVSEDGKKRNLLVLPGSRRAEVRGLLGPFGETVEQLACRGADFDVLMPTVPHVEQMVRDGTANWAVKPQIFTDPDRKWQAYGKADAALACSGTVTLELALARVPMAVCYKLDMFGHMLMKMITVWSASLPNLIAGWPVVPEHYDRFIRPAYLARQLEQLWRETPVRSAQLAGFSQVADTLSTPSPSGELAAQVVLGRIGEKRRY